MTGKTISHYQILEQIGQGGMGVIFKAVDVSLNRPVALKFLSEGSLPLDEFTRFRNEARAISSLNHKNIATIHELGSSDDQQFIVLEFLPGGTLKEKIRRHGTLPVEEAVDVAAQIAEGLSYAHSKYVVHRDIKSDNIMFSDDGIPKITDFGISKIKTATTKTRTEVIAGTIAYMSPEQLQGSTIDNRSDIWSLGVVLFEMLTGVLPFQHHLQPSLIFSIITKDPTSIASRRPDVPERIQAIVMRCLDKDPDKRFQTAGELVQALRGEQTGTQAVPVPAKTNMMSRYWWIAAALGVVLLTYLFLPPIIQTEAVPSVAVLYLKNLGPESDEPLSYGITHALIVDLARAGWIRVSPMNDVIKIKDSSQSLEKIANTLGVRHVLEGSILRQDLNFTISVQLVDVKTKLTVWAEHYLMKSSELPTLEGAMALSILKALEVTPTSQTRKEISSMSGTNPEAYEYYLKARYKFDNKKSKEDVKGAKELFQKAIDLDAGLLSARIGLGECFVYEGNADAATNIHEETLALAKSRSERAVQAACYRGMGEINANRGDYQHALEYYNLGLSIAREIGDRTGEGKFLYNIGLIHWDQSNYQKALEYYSGSLRIWQELGDRSGQARTLKQLGVVYWGQYDFPHALDNFNLALTIAEQIHDRPLEGNTLNDIANVYEGQGDYMNALRMYERSLEIQKTLGDRRGESRGLSNIGLIHRNLGNYKTALEEFSRAEQICVELDDRKTLGVIWSNIGLTLNEQDQHDRAREYHAKSVGIAKEIGDQGSEAYRVQSLGTCYVLLNDLPKAMESFAESERMFLGIEDTISAVASSSWLLLATVQSGKILEAQSTINNLDTLLRHYSHLDEPITVYWNMAQIHTSLGNLNVARTYLEQSYSEIISRANKIPDETLRTSYLSNVRVNRDVLNGRKRLLPQTP
ncbi:MAG: tetratricopeptide repeat protein [Ignavibacteria bacterium]|nr:tetratricopeptide repeat protein [Ignavibacteria bacterium]